MELYRALINIIWIKSVLNSSAQYEPMAIQIGLFGLLGTKSALKATLMLATTIECDIDQESSVNSLKSPPFHAKRSCM